MAEGGSALTPRQRRAVKLIAQGRPLTHVAKELGIGTSTIQLWKSTKPEFNLAVEVELRNLEQLADDELRSAFAPAVLNARRLLACGQESVELGASRLVIESVDKLLLRRSQQDEIDDLRARVQELAQLVDQRQREQV